ncbi:DUF4386 domain-containing protein [Fusibacter ferrireducens]|uniref:DUF4386 domain-containing protein n=1 Tax=Fusibacter ferrireducens TaxID=2785058 RepID=A0ABR9ZSM8_9FIRM|nr:DUF4386 domain-containing protein [Fusibacter ferrireducens]MBF4693472.1 DUF4386 domain-containing protein [Fusibacter ferrireducens]
MTNHPKINSLRLAALFSSISLFIMTLAAAFSYGFVNNQIFVNTDPLLTLSNLKEASGLFKAGLLGWLLIIVTDVLVSWGFYVFFLKTNRKISTLGAIFRLSYVALLITAVINLVQISRIASSANMVSDSIDPGHIMILFQQFDYFWSLGLILFGFHLICIGFLASKDHQVPNFIGLLLLIAGLSYALIHILYRFFPDFHAFTTTLETLLSLPMIVGELGFGIWLWIKGGK